MRKSVKIMTQEAFSFIKDLFRFRESTYGRRRYIPIEMIRMKKTDNALDNTVIQAIREWMKRHDAQVVFYGGFAAFDEEGNVSENRLICYGHKAVLRPSVDAFMEEFAKEEDFVNW